MSGLSLSLGLTMGAQRAAFSAEAQAYFAAMAVQPDDARKVLINNLINNLIVNGVWARLDCLFLLAATTSQAGLLNAVNPAQTATLVNAPTFTVDRGFTTNGTTSYVDTGFNPSTAGGKYTQTLAYFGIWVNAETQFAASPAGWFDGTDGVTVNPRTAADAMNGRVNEAAAITAAAPGTSALGLSAVNRLSNSNTRLTRNGVLVQSGSAASTALNNNNLYLGRSATASYAAGRFAACAIGSVNAATDLALYNALNTYFTAIGAA